MEEGFLGEVKMFAGTYAPKRWALPHREMRHENIRKRIV